MSKYIDLLKSTFAEWTNDDVPRLAASLAFYTAISLAPLLLIVLALLGFFFGDEAARGQIMSQFSSELGAENARIIEGIIEDSGDSGSGIISTVISVVMLIFGATGVFMQLQNALNEIWDIEVDGGILDMLKKRLLSFGMIMTLGFLLLVSLVINGVIASLDTFLAGVVPGMQIIAHSITTIISFGVSTLLFAILYKYMPDAEIEWQDVLIGAVVTSLLFTIGRFFLSLYLGNAGPASSYGAAGSFLVILLWVYYSAQIVMFGAEFTQVYARRYGSRIVPEEGASFNLNAKIKASDISMEDIDDYIEQEISTKSNEEVADAIKEDGKRKTDKVATKLRTKGNQEVDNITEAPKPDIAAIVNGKEPKEIVVEERQPTTNVVLSTFIALSSIAIGWFIGQRQR